MYQALYRKWRPRTFEEVVGQEHITTTLKNEMIQGKPAHAYLLMGSRGTGKTTCAKLIAKAVNCRNPVDGSPCGQCDCCRGVDNGSLVDVVEIDAASNNGVDNIRDLREEAVFLPNIAKYRVYIIDEAHMLSVGAVNALLKIMEEPPEHVIFILATTEVHKIPATIQSRCQRFDFKRIAPEVIRDRLLFIAGQEDMTLAVCVMPFLSLIFAGHTPMISPWRPSAKRPGLWGRIIFLRSPMLPRRGILPVRWMPWSAWPDRLWNMTACAVN